MKFIAQKTLTIKCFDEPVIVDQWAVVNQKALENFRALKDTNQDTAIEYHLYQLDEVNPDIITFATR